MRKVRSGRWLIAQIPFGELKKIATSAPPDCRLRLLVLAGAARIDIESSSVPLLMRSLVSLGCMSEATCDAILRGVE